MKRLLILTTLAMMTLSTAGCCGTLFSRLRGWRSGCNPCDSSGVYGQEAVYMPPTLPVQVQPGPAASTPPG